MPLENTFAEAEANLGKQCKIGDKQQKPIPRAATAYGRQLKRSSNSYFHLVNWGRNCTKFYEPLLVAHILKFLPLLRVLALPKQCDDDVASVVGLNCPKLECIILTGTSVTNVGLSWLLCCRQLHTLIMPGFFQGVTPKGNYSMHFVH